MARLTGTSPFRRPTLLAIVTGLLPVAIAGSAGALHAQGLVPEREATHSRTGAQPWDAPVFPGGAGLWDSPGGEVPLPEAAEAVTAPTSPQAPTISLTPIITSGLTSPVAMTNAGDGSGRLFINEQAGTIRIWNGTSLLATPFLDIHTLVSCCVEQGLLSAAFHPSYASNGFFFVYYTDTSSPNYNLVIARYKVSSGDPNLADPTSGVVLLSIPHPTNNNHNGGQLQFGPDGYLYIGTGDGGSGDDPPCNAQNNQVLLGKLLRIDVDQNVSTPPYYGIPPTNPFAGLGNPQDKIWDKGLRNSWRYSFDRTTGDLYIGDVGQNAWEEIDFEPAGGPGGVNYGWKVMEGFHCGGGGTSSCPVGTPPCNDPSYTLPILEYSHSFGCSVTGGYVYRGLQFPGLHGYYLYSDYCSGRIWGAARNAAGAWSTNELLMSGLNVSSFGQDEQARLYVVGLGGQVSRIDSSTSWPLPTISSISPPAVIAGDPTFTLTVDGSGFAPGSMIRWNGANRTTTYVSLTRLTASIPASDVASTGTATVTVFNPAPGGGTSGGATLNIAPTFLDVPQSYWARRWIQAIYNAGLTSGCGSRIFCPDSATTRAQMAVFLLRGHDGSSYNPPAATGAVFSDVAATAFAAAWIEQLAARGITAGCGGGNYCPDSPVLREQMAVFVLRTKFGSAYTPVAATGIFADLPASSPYARWAEDLYNKGITAGCGVSPLRFCPMAVVTRAQMAVFIATAFGLPVPP